MTLRDWTDPLREEILARAGEAVELVSRSVAAIYGVRRRKHDFLGSGTYVRHRKNIYVITAKHVVDRSGSYETVCSDIGGSGERLVPLKSGWTGFREEDGDIALWQCFDEVLEKSDRIPIPLIESFGSPDAHRGTLLMATGYPATRAVSMPFMRVEQLSLHVPVGCAVDGPGLSEFAFAFTCLNDIEYHGMSGSPVWNLNLDSEEDLEGWKPEETTFAGVLTRWDKPSGTLFATKAEALKGFLSGGYGAIARLRKKD